MVNKKSRPIEWAPRIKPHKIRRLYELDAKGILDEDLIDEVGYGLLFRCETIHRVTHRLCPDCGGELEGAWESASRYRKIRCKSCGWQATWISYHTSYKGKRIHGGRAFGFFEDYLKRFPKCRGPRAMMLEIDRLIHEVHESTDNLWTSPAASNLIQGKGWEVAALLDALAYGEDIPAERKKIREAYFARMKESENLTESHIARTKSKGK